jgi:hypothetical protein
MSEPTQTGATDFNGAVSRLSALFRPEQNTPPVDEQNANQTEVSDNGEETASDGDTGSSESTYKVKVNGEEVEVSLDELQKGYMMGRDYTQKTMHLSEQRKALEQKVAKIDTDLEDAREILATELEWFESEEAKELREYNPDEFLRKFERIKVKADKFERIRADREAEKYALYQENLKREQELLRQKIPDWVDEKTVQREYPQLVESMKAIGFNDAELQAISDHRLMVMARKAMLFDQIMNQDVSSKKVKSPPKSASPGSPKSPTEVSDRRSKELREKVKQKGDMQSAAEAIKSMFFK